MIGKKTLKDFGFSQIENYFDYIIVSEKNGNFSQVRELFKRLSSDQKRLFFAYIQRYDKSLRFDFDLRRLF